ncbi:hypothetical protein F2Q69_00035108 [Brassica cretica]|uniref:Uncharacterized protein n=1 Tax=Brassica cretica TaxID=69181 RepID=A0A8S9SIB7_BRACR|nr:hypothetical protein F2Q69_00035108 [Brassica cretica]
MQDIISSPMMSREGSLTTVVLWFTGTFPGEPLSGCRRTSHTVDFVLALLLLTKFRSQRTNSRFPPPGSETTNQLGVAPFHLYDARIHDNSSLNPDLIRSSSLSSPLSVLSSSLACPLLNRGSAHLHQPSLSPSGFDDRKQDQSQLWDYKSIYMSLVNIMVSIKKYKKPLKNIKIRLKISFDSSRNGRAQPASANPHRIVVEDTPSCVRVGDPAWLRPA